MKILNVNLANISFSNNIGQIEKSDTVKLLIDLEDRDYTNSTIKILGKKSDRTFVEQIIDTSVVNNKLEIILNKQFTTAQGIVKLELNIVTNSEEWTSKEFYFVVSNTINSNIIESITDVQTLKDLENYLIYSKKEIEQIKLELASVSYDKLLEIKRLLESENNLAGTNIATIRELLVTTNTILDTLEATIRTANTSKANLDTSIDTSINNSSAAKTNLDNSISTASTKKRELDTSITTATEKNTELTNSNNLATENINTIATKITEAGTANTNIQNSIQEANTVKEELNTSIQNGDLQGIKDNIRLTQEEVEKARGTSLDLKEELDRRDSVMLDNIAQQYLPLSFTGSTKVEDTFNGKALNAEVKGRTLHNLISLDTTKYINGGGAINNPDGTISVNITKRHYVSLMFSDVNRQKFTNGEYTALFDFELSKSNYGDGTNPTRHCLVIFYNTDGTYENVTVGKAAIGTRKSGVVKFNLTKPFTKIEFRLFTADLPNPSTEVVGIVHRAIIVKGFEDNIDVPYFEGIASTGSAESNVVGLKSCGKNLFKGEFQQLSSTYGHYNFGNYDMATYSVTDKDTSIDLTGISLGDCKFNGSSINWLYSHNTLYDRSRGINNRKLCFYPNNEESWNKINSRFLIQIESGVNSTNYEPYKESQVTCKVPFDGGLKGIGDVSDKWLVNEGKIEQKNTIKIFNGTESFLISKEDANKIRFAYSNLNIAPTKNPNIAGAISNKFKSISHLSVIQFNEVGISVHDSSNQLNIVINKSDLETHDIAGFKKLLQKWDTENNPLIVYHVLETPVIHKIPAQQLATFKAITHLAQENSICGQVSCKVAVDVPATLSRLEQEKETLKDENIELNNRLIKQATHFTDADLDLTSNNLELDFRIMDIEFMLDMPINLVVKEVKNMSPYEMMKKLILAGRYEKEDMEYKITVYLQRGRITEAEAQELRDLMLANEILAK